ncbi:MAG: DEAD/DEAH box helicase family protein [Patescibacteria group bacterium]
MIQPYWYQEDGLKAIQRARQKGAVAALVVMASGLGKTVTGAFDCLRFRKMHPKARVLYLCHQNNILQQARTTFEVIHGNECSFGFYHGTKKDLDKVDFLFASLQTMRKQRKSFRPDEFDYVIIDESHRTSADTYLDVVEYWKPKFLLGMTATPNRTDGQDIRKVFGREVFYLPLEEALAQGLLAPVDYRLLTDEIQLKRVIEAPGHRLSLAMLNRKVFVAKRDEEIISLIQKHIRAVIDPRSIVFCESIEYCDRLSRLMPNSIAIHSKVSFRERVIRLEMFRQGVIPTLLVVDVFNEGIDIPKANVLVFLRSTSSPIVLFQQLGRGLRLSEGKTGVLVLDFVGNCERVKTIYTLWQDVATRRQHFLARPPTGPKAEKLAVRRQTEPFLLNVDHVHFQEKAVQITELVRRITEGYTRDEMVALLKGFAAKLGRSPTQVEVQGNKEMPSGAALSNEFGNFSNALLAAGLAVNQMLNVSDEILLEQLRVLRDELGRSPTQKDIAAGSKAGRCSCEPVFRSHFGSLGAALEKIDAKPTKYVGLGKPALIKQLQALHTENGRTPSVDDVIQASADHKTASPNVFRQAFGSWSHALLAAGLVEKAKKPKRYSEADLISQLQKAKMILGRRPSCGDIERLRKQGQLSASVGAFCGRFGSFTEALIRLAQADG